MPLLSSQHDIAHRIKAVLLSKFQRYMKINLNSMLAEIQYFIKRLKHTFGLYQTYLSIHLSILIGLHLLQLC